MRDATRYFLIVCEIRHLWHYCTTCNKGPLVGEIMEYNKEKFKNLVHYIAANCEDAQRLGAVKLNKILWYADTIAYQIRGDSITGASYVKRQFGPVPAHILAALRELGDEERVLTVEVRTMGKVRREFISISNSTVEGFTAEEIATVDHTIGWICDNHTAQSISNLSHDQIWEMAAIGEEIPINTVLVSSLGEVDENDMYWGIKHAQQFSAQA